MLNDIDHYLYVLYIALPAFLANMLPVIAAKKNWIKSLDKPISSIAFGEHKTWRGLIVGTLGAVSLSILFFIFKPIAPFHSFLSSILFGFLAGSGALLGDMLKSFIKRRLGIKSGQPFIPFDQIDYIIGFVLATSVVFQWLLWDIAFLLLFALVFNPVTNYVAYILKIKKTYW